ncbi:dipeptidase [Aureibaculum sp. 2210JD6-5]|uniref:dipeptidase n=1 Tax=Aureibaculum sp. 2210JD6-5 TaxID=3103957 RepID=UPI002AAC50FC|nr:dipeptidase [Aureibaculum sp. 2210JD6-5]MDY7395029.1 dipeptidase [Aureibaculum sp. 2210JD6-5]
MKNTLILMALIILSSCNMNKKTDAKETEIDSTKTNPEVIIPEIKDTLAYAKQIHERVITLDTHADINVANFTKDKNYTQRLESQVNLPKMEEGGLDVVWFIVYTGQKELNEAGYKKAYANAISKFDAIHRLTEEFAPDKIELALTSDDVRRINAAGKKVAMIGVENGYPIGTDINRVKEFYDLGARYMSLAHNGHSQLADSNTGEKDNVWLHNGLSDLGKQVIAEMNKYGMMIDLSHPSIEANKQAIALSKAPVIASHSSARAVCDHSRNLTDEVLKLIKEKKGVVQTVAFKGYTRLENSKDVNVSDFVDHIDYMVNLIGIDHVGISSDFDGGGGINGWNDASETFNVTLELVKRGYTEDQISKLWGGNLLRVLDDVQKVATEIQEKS